MGCNVAATFRSSQKLNVEYTPLYRLLSKLEDDKEVMSDKTGKFHTKLYFLQNDCKTKMQNEKLLLTNCNHSENNDDKFSFCKTPKSAKRNEKLQNENGGEPEDERIDPWDIETT
ncbi:MAG: hypothetical protein L0Y68_09460 [Candidatus Dadabacteria bacterium]|nr:hypothetical protein [Candidatus Dadabacteria bacterium]